jgi:hypothetical protein
MLHAQISQYPLLSLNATTAAVLTFLVLFDKILARMASLARTIRRVKKEWNAP